jgi:DNA-binding CsgD family transcriptional regulator
MKERNAPGFRTTGYFFAAIFVAGAVMSAVLAIAEGKPVLNAILHPYVIICLAISALMFFSARNKVFSWFQPLVWLAGATIAIFSYPMQISGLCFFIIAVLLLFRFGFYEKMRTGKIIATFVVFYSLEIASSFISKTGITDKIADIFIITLLFITLYLAYQEKLMVYLKEPKETLSLKGKGLTDAEQKYVLAMVGGKSPKEIAFFYEVSESTVRNTLARAYKKLGVGDRSELAALAARVELVA